MMMKSNIIMINIQNGRFKKLLAFSAIMIGVSHVGNDANSMEAVSNWWHGTSTKSQKIKFTLVLSSPSSKGDQNQNRISLEGIDPEIAPTPTEASSSHSLDFGSSTPHSLYFAKTPQEAFKYLPFFESDTYEATLSVMGDSPFDDTWSPFLTSIPQLHMLKSWGGYYSPRVLITLVDNLKITNLSHYDFRANRYAFTQYNDEAMKVLGKLFGHNKMIKKIDLGALISNATDSGTSFFLTSLENQPKLTHLELNNLQLKGTESIKALTRVIRSAPVLQSLTMTTEEDTILDLSDLCNALKTHPALLKLDFSFEKDYFSLLADLLKDNPIIQTVNLRASTSNDSVGSIKVLGEAISVNKTLRELKFSYLGTPQLTMGFFEGLKGNNSLTTLSLHIITFDEQSSKACADFLTTNTSLEHLKLDIMTINDAQVKILVAGLLKRSKPLKTLHFSYDSKAIGDMSLWTLLMTKGTSIKPSAS